jgi:hypothetical protein
MNEKSKCPLSKTLATSGFAYFEDCMGNRCAWWIGTNEQGECAIKQIAKRVT